ncbi:hypothetical protein CLIB1423_01S01288 [[Candida] railenensis]|uniref:Uncharacterized protein n=1 Tax=[Candida] railenensis TaxID=45579 RepID=A0A9P0VVK2_9ASCO|nr:hypothetical protein CLIB1423_01S01288 [[Candida] railenensis]
MSTSFIDRVQSQSIFNSSSFKIEPRSSPLQNQPHTISNVATCRNNTEIFLASGNVVRCCSINSKTSNYKVLHIPHLDYVIRNLILNDKGNMLAIVGDGSQVTVCFLPTSISSSSVSSIEVKHYRLSIEDSLSIKKCIWQPSVANGNCLVVLTDDDVIRNFDLSISSIEPQLVVDLKKEGNFKGETAASIAFGNQNLLSGTLSLYVLTLDGGKVFAIYPFIHQAALILTSRNDIKQLHDETVAINNYVEQSGSENASKLAEAQFKYVDYIYSQLFTPVSPRIDGASGKFVLSQMKNASDQSIALQGPLFDGNSTGKGSDITSINGVGNLSLLASSSIASDEVFINYYGQLSSLLMKWKNSDTSLQTISKPATPKNSHGYKKLTRGFGYIDEEEDDDNDVEESRTKNDNSVLKKFLSVTHLRTDILLSTKEIKVELSSYDSTFLIRIGRSEIFSVSPEWFRHIFENFSIDESKDIIYKSISKQPLKGFFIAKDVITEEGTFIISTDDNGILKIEQIVKGIELNKIERKPTNFAIDASRYKTLSATPLLTNEPFQELQAEIDSLSQNLKNTPLRNSIIERNIALDKKIPISDSKYLTSVNQLSIQTIRHVSEFTHFALNLKGRLDKQLDTLRESISLLNKVRNSSVKSPEELESINSKIAELDARQVQIVERLNKVHQLIFDAVQKLKISNQLPLSDSETSWFKEINSIAALANVKFKNSVKESKQQINKLLEDIAVETVTNDLNDLSLSNKVNKVKLLLEKEGQLISLAMTRLEFVNKNLD